MIAALPIATALLSVLSDESEVDLVELLQRALAWENPKIFYDAVSNGGSAPVGEGYLIDLVEKIASDGPVPRDVYLWQLLAFRTLLIGHCETHENDELLIQDTVDGVPIEKRQVKYATLRDPIARFDQKGQDRLGRAIIEGTLRCIEAGLLGSIDVGFLFVVNENVRFDPEQAEFIVNGHLVASTRDGMMRISCRMRMPRSGFDVADLIINADKQNVYEDMLAEGDVEHEEWKKIVEENWNRVTKETLYTYLIKVSDEDLKVDLLCDRFLSLIELEDCWLTDPVDPDKTWAAKSMKEVLTLQSTTQEQFSEIIKRMTAWLTGVLDAFAKTGELPVGEGE